MGKINQGITFIVNGRALGKCVQQRCLGYCVQESNHVIAVQNVGKYIWLPVSSKKYAIKLEMAQ